MIELFGGMCALLALVGVVLAITFGIGLEGIIEGRSSHDPIAFIAGLLLVGHTLASVALITSFYWHLNIAHTW